VDTRSIGCSPNAAVACFNCERFRFVASSTSCASQHGDHKGMFDLRQAQSDQPLQPASEAAEANPQLHPERSQGQGQRHKLPISAANRSPLRIRPSPTMSCPVPIAAAMPSRTLSRHIRAATAGKAPRCQAGQRWRLSDRQQFPHLAGTSRVSLAKTGRGNQTRFGFTSDPTPLGVRRTWLFG
jgi:hypothetical protein